MRAVGMVMAIALGVGCGGKAVRQDFEATRAAAQWADETPPPHWRGDAWMHVAPEPVEALVTTWLTTHALQTHLNLGIAALRPTVELGNIALKPARDCDACIGVTGDLALSLGYRAPGVAGEHLSEGQFAANLELVADRADGAWRLRLAPASLKDIELSLDGAPRLIRFAEGPIGSWLKERILTRMEPITLTQWEPSGDALRAVRPRWSPAGLALEILTRGPDTPIAMEAPRTAEGWSARIPSGTLLALARAEALSQEPIRGKYWAEPRSLDLDGDRLAVDLRIWKIGAASWWRDYRLTGQLQTTMGHVQVGDVASERVGHSRGALLADPLPGLAQKRIKEALEAAMRKGLPTTLEADAGEQVLRASIREIHGEGDDIVMSGPLAARE